MIQKMTTFDDFIKIETQEQNWNWPEIRDLLCRIGSKIWSKISLFH